MAAIVINDQHNVLSDPFDLRHSGHVRHSFILFRINSAVWNSQCSELLWRSTIVCSSSWVIESQHVLGDGCGTQPGSKRGLSVFRAINKEFTHSTSAFGVVHNGAHLVKWVGCVWGLGARHNEILMEQKDLIFPKLSSISATVQLRLPHL